MIVDPTDRYEDSLLVEAAREGDRRAYDLLVSRHQDAVYNLAYRMTGNRDDALELSQEALLKAWNALDRFGGNSSFFTWLYRIAINTTLSARRKARRRQGQVSMQAPGGRDDDEATMQLPDPSPGAEDEVDRQERRRLVQQAIGELDDEFRVVVVLRDIQQLSYDEISRFLDLPVGTVKSRIFRARTELKEKLSFLLK